MKAINQIVILLGIVLSVTGLKIVQCKQNEYIVSQYYSPKTFELKNFHPKDLKWNELTHLNYGPFVLTEECEIKSSNKQVDFHHEIRELGNVEGVLEALKHYKRRYNTKVVLTVGGYKYSKYFKRCVENKSKREKIIRSLTHYMEKYDFDGVDYDWQVHNLVLREREREREYSDIDYENLLRLVKETHEIFEEKSEKQGKYVVSITGSHNKKHIKQLEERVDGFLQYIDYINLFTFEYEQPGYSTLIAPFSDEWKEGSNVEETVRNYLNIRVPRRKIVLGLASYGRGFTGSKGLSKEYEGELRGDLEYGMMSYSKVQEYYNEGGYEKYSVAGVPYLYNREKEIFITYEDEKSIKLKTQLAYEKRLGGIFLYQAGYDYDNKLFEEAQVTLRILKNGERNYTHTKHLDTEIVKELEKKEGQPEFGNKHRYNTLSTKLEKKETEDGDFYKDETNKVRNKYERNEPMTQLYTQLSRENSERLDDLDDENSQKVRSENLSRGQGRNKVEIHKVIKTDKFMEDKVTVAGKEFQKEETLIRTPTVNELIKTLRTPEYTKQTVVKRDSRGNHISTRVYKTKSLENTKRNHFQYKIQKPWAQYKYKSESNNQLIEDQDDLIDILETVEPKDKTVNSQCFTPRCKFFSRYYSVYDSVYQEEPNYHVEKAVFFDNDNRDYLGLQKKFTYPVSKTNYPFLPKYESQHKHEANVAYETELNDEIPHVLKEKWNKAHIF